MSDNQHAAREAARVDKRHKWAVMACCVFAYCYVFPYQATLNNPNENVRLYMTAAIAELGRYDIDALRERWGFVNDAAVHGGHIWSVKAPGTSLLGVPAYYVYFHVANALGHAFDRTEALWLCRITASVLPTLIFLWFFYDWLGRRARHALSRDALFFSAALGSLLYGYGMMFVSHTQSAITAFGAFMWLYDVHQKEREPSLLGAFVAGLLTAGATFFEYPGLACSLPLAIYGAVVLWRKPQLLAAFAVGGVLPALVMMHFQWIAFGSPFTPGHLFVENDAFRAAHEKGVYGAVGPSARALYGLLFEPDAGLFPLTPLLALGIPGLYLLARDTRTRADAIAASFAVALTVLAIASMNNWRGGWTIGARYLALCIPFLAWSALPVLDRLADATPRIAAGVAIGGTAVGLLASGLPSAYYPHLPPEITRPLPQVFAVLIARGFAPMNAAALLGIHGSSSMLPLLVCALCVLSLCVSLVPRALRMPAIASAIVCAALLCVPLLVRPSHEPGVKKAVSFITGRYWPGLDVR